MGLRAKVAAIAEALGARRSKRRALRGPAALRYAIADSVGMLDSNAWDAVTSESGFFLSRPYLQALERVLPANLSPRYALIAEDTGSGLKTIAAVYMQLADINLAQIGKEAEAAHGLRKLPAVNHLAETTTQRVLCCGNLLTFGQHGIAFAPDIDLGNAWHGIAEVLYRVRKADRLRGKTHFVLIKDLHAPFDQTAADLTQLSYRHVETEPNMLLALDPSWKSYDDYLAGLAAKYRSNIKNGIMKPIEAAGLTVGHLTGLGDVEQVLFKLYKSVQANAGFRPFELRPEYFAALERMAGSRFRCSVVRRDDHIVGFLISVADGETCIAYHVGFDRAEAEKAPVYLRLLHCAIADGIALGCRQVSFGRTALEPKAALGAKPQAFSVLVRHRQPVLNKLIKRLLLGVHHDDAPERNPFKQHKAAKADAGDGGEAA